MPVSAATTGTYGDSLPLGRHERQQSDDNARRDEGGEGEVVGRHAELQEPGAARQLVELIEDVPAPFFDEGRLRLAGLERFEALGQRPHAVDDTAEAVRRRGDEGARGEDQDCRGDHRGEDAETRRQHGQVGEVRVEHRWGVADRGGGSAPPEVSAGGAGANRGRRGNGRARQGVRQADPQLFVRLRDADT